ncbi:hypothetical protein K438DRAFT_1587247, partial [Mycena galopus ATCC 62051]
RLPHVSFEEFDRHWYGNFFHTWYEIEWYSCRAEVHKPIVESLPAVKSGLVKYKQFHIYPSTNAALAALGTTVMPYDGIVEWEAKRLEDILELFASEELIKNALPDEKNFFERSSVQAVTGNWT